MVFLSKRIEIYLKSEYILASMRRSQWFVFAFVLSLMFMFFMWDASLQARNANMIFSLDMNAVDSNLYNALTVRSALYGSFGTVCLGLFFIFLICGWLERRQK